MLAYLWFCVMLRAVSPGADLIITRYNQAMEAFVTAGLIGEQPPSREHVYHQPDPYYAWSESAIIAENGALRDDWSSAERRAANDFAAPRSEMRLAPRSADAWKMRSTG